MTKLYKFAGSSKSYFQTWPSTFGKHTIHYGELGTNGEEKAIGRSLLESAKSKVEKEIEARISDGYAEVDPDDHYMLRIIYDVAGMGDVDQLRRMHRLENRLDDLLLRTGLGECSGNEIGGGTMVVFSDVVDYALAERVIKEDLVGTEFSGYAKIDGGNRLGGRFVGAESV